MNEKVQSVASTEESLYVKLTEAKDLQQGGFGVYCVLYVNGREVYIYTFLYIYTKKNIRTHIFININIDSFLCIYIYIYIYI